MSNENAMILRRWFDEVWNKKNTAVIREIMSDETVHHGLSGPGGPPMRGIADFEAYHAALVGAFPDLHIDVDDVIQDGEKVGARLTITGTQQGDFQGLPATGKKTRFTAGGMCTFKDGKFDEVWNEVDFPKLQYDLAPDTPDVE